MGQFMFSLVDPHINRRRAVAAPANKSFLKVIDRGRHYKNSHRSGSKFFLKINTSLNINIKEDIADYQSQINTAWNLSPKLQEFVKQKISLIVNEREHLPRADVTYQFKSPAGVVKVRITTAGETFKLGINAGKNPMAAQMACIEFEKQLSFIALTTRTV